MTQKIKVGDQVLRTGKTAPAPGPVFGQYYIVSEVLDCCCCLRLQGLSGAWDADKFEVSFSPFVNPEKEIFSPGDTVLRTGSSNTTFGIICGDHYIVDTLNFVGRHMKLIGVSGDWDIDGFELAHKGNSSGVVAKETNPKDAVGIKKPPMSTVSALVMKEVGVAMLEGARKYGRHNYRVSGVRGSVYYDAARRHIDNWWEGQDIDPDSGLSHVTKAIASLVVLRDAMIQGKLVDDRPPTTVNLEEFDAALQKKVEEIFVKLPNAKEAFTNGN